jgi:2-C-methyl-D-erythritol 4-phosphate cytidylyltransferase
VTAGEGERPPRIGVAVPAAGAGRRMGEVRKPWLELVGEPLIVHALRPFLADGRVVAVRVALAADDAADPPGWLSTLDPRVGVVAGGASRSESVARAVAALPAQLDVILVHDAARPLVSADVIDRVVAAALGGTGAVAGWPATDTLKRVDADRRIVGTPDRERIWHAQTPQGFPAELLRRALRGADAVGATDDAGLVERAGGVVVMVPGSAHNFKVTRPEDVTLAEALLRSRAGADA